MKYHSTIHHAPPATLEEALLRGLAPDGGLYVPERIPRFSEAELRALRAARPADPEDGLAFLQAVGVQVLAKWFEDEIEPRTLRAIVAGAQRFPIPVRRVGRFWVMELFHGPTMAFKDVAARHLARLMNFFLAKQGERVTLLVATSGDTGGAIADGFADQDAIRVVILFPKGRVSRLQEEQLTRVAANVLPVEVEGTFDDCQALAKRAFLDPTLRPLRLASANSINIARLLPQIVPYVYAALRLDQPNLEVIVPSGNFGNVTAALLARAMGAPIHGIVAATNRNDAAARLYQTGRYEPQPTVQTLSTAMDVGNPSNLARVLALAGHDADRFRQLLRVFRISDEETIATMRRVYEEHGYLLCPHSAVGWAVAERHACPNSQPLVVATASPRKFAAEIRAATGIEVDDRAEIAQLQRHPKRKVTIENRWEVLEPLLWGMSPGTT